MEFRQLKYFTSAAKHLNFTLAAKECFISQPTMSQQIKQLENELGVTLFRRQNNTLELTEAGQRLYQDAARILNHVSVAEINLRKKQVTPKLRIGYYGSGLGRHFPQILRKYKLTYPQVQLQLIQGTQSSVTKALEQQQLDCIISDYNPELHDSDWLQSFLLLKNPMRAYAAEGLLELQAGEPLSLAGPLPVPVVSQTEYWINMMNYEFKKEAEDFSNILPHGSNYKSTILLTESGQTILIAPEVDDQISPYLCAYPIKEADLHIFVYLMWHRSNCSKTVDSFRKLAFDFLNIAYT